MNNPSRYTKIKVITGYVLLLVLTIAAIVFIYKQISKFTGDESLVSSANQKLYLIGNTITGLYEAESLSSSFLQTGSSGSFRKYIAIIRQVEENIDSLKRMTPEVEQQSRIDTIHLLLNDKIRNLKELLRVKKSQEAEKYYTQAIASIESAKDSLTTVPDIRRRIVTTRDTSYIKGIKKKKGFLGLFSSKEPDSTLQVTVSSREIWDTIRNHSGNTPDSILNILRSTWENFQAENESLNRQINQREYQIVNQSVEITKQLRKVLYNYEMEEITHSLDRMAQREQVMNSSAHLIAVIAIIAVLFVAFFCTLILKDISRSQRYRLQLEAANAYTAQLLKSREQLMLTVTHDIKSPLSSVMGYIELLATTPTDERQRYFLKNMKSSSEHIQHLISDLLDLSKLENNRMTVEEVIFNPAQLFREIADTFIPLATAKQLKLNCKIDEFLNANYEGDALRIRQILTNILSNAVKYTEEGEVSFSAAVSEENPGILLQVNDTGPGMTTEEQKVIFEEFTRLKSHAGIEGTGLGLTITLKLIHLLKGEIKLESEPGRGSRFTIFLPLLRIGDTQEAGGLSSEQTMPFTTVCPSSLKVLLVDDDPLQLEMTAGLLQKYGIHCKSTNNPQLVREKILREHYDLIFTDIQMPGMNGFELIRQIRESKDTSQLPVVALSADAGKEEEEYIQAGFTAYLGKPFTSGQLLGIIRQICGITFLQPTVRSEQETISLQENPELYTLKNIRQFTDNDETATCRIIASFIEETRKHLVLLEEYLQQGQTENIARLAHKMLPMFRQLEVKEITGLLQTLEHCRLSPEEIRNITEEVTAKTEQLLQSME